MDAPMHRPLATGLDSPGKHSRSRPRAHCDHPGRIARVRRDPTGCSNWKRIAYEVVAERPPLPHPLAASSSGDKAGLSPCAAQRLPTEPRFLPFVRRMILSDSSWSFVSAHLLVRPADRERYLHGCASVVELTCSPPGCLDFASTADLVDPGRIGIFEQWEPRAGVETFRGRGPSDE